MHRVRRSIHSMQRYWSTYLQIKVVRSSIFVRVAPFPPWPPAGTVGRKNEYLQSPNQILISGIKSIDIGWNFENLFCVTIVQSSHTGYEYESTSTGSLFYLHSNAMHMFQSFSSTWISHRGFDGTGACRGQIQRHYTHTSSFCSYSGCRLWVPALIAALCRSFLRHGRVAVQFDRWWGERFDLALRTIRRQGNVP